MAVLYIFVCLACLSVVLGNNSFTVQMNGHPTQEDQYCSSVTRIPNYAKGRRVIGFEPLNGFSAHHIIMYSCSRDMSSPENTDLCKMRSECEEEIVFVWAQGGGPLFYPPQVGLLLGEGAVQAFGLQVHYGYPVKDATRIDKSGIRVYLSEILDDALDGSSSTDKSAVVKDTSEWFSPSMWLLAPGHFPNLKHGTQQTMVGESNLVVPRALSVFAVRTHAHDRGLWNEVKAFRKNQQIWAYRRSVKLPQSFIPLPSHVLLEAGDTLQYNCAYDTSHENHDIGVGSSKHDEMCNVYLMYFETPVKNDCQLSTALGGEMTNSVPHNAQVVGVDANSQFIYIFHRANRIWETNSFNNQNEFAYPPITENTLLQINARTGKVVDSFGKDLFYLPHSVKIDPTTPNTLWLLDVGAHSVFEFDLVTKAIKRTIGTVGKPGRDKQKTFCQPTDLAFSSDGKLLYITDGYCNDRIVVVRKNDLAFVNEITAADLRLPHAIALSWCGSTQNKDYLLVCNRETGNVLVYDTVSNQVVKRIRDWPGNWRPYSVSVDAVTNRVFVGLVERSGSDYRKGYIWRSTNGICAVLAREEEVIQGRVLCKDGMQEPHMLAMVGRNLLVAEAVDSVFKGNVYVVNV